VCRHSRASGRHNSDTGTLPSLGQFHQPLHSCGCLQNRIVQKTRADSLTFRIRMKQKVVFRGTRAGAMSDERRLDRLWVQSIAGTFAFGTRLSARRRTIGECHALRASLADRYPHSNHSFNRIGHRAPLNGTRPGGKTRWPSCDQHGGFLFFSCCSRELKIMRVMRGGSESGVKAVKSPRGGLFHSLDFNF